MATKFNKKFFVVAVGFAIAAAVLLVGVVLVNKYYIQDPERNVRRGDKLMAEGKPREAFAEYGRAVKKKPSELQYIDKMRTALDQIKAANATQANEDYGALMGIAQARTRAQPTDPAQWKALLELLEDEAEIYSKGEGWANIETIAKEMKEAVPADAPGAELAAVYLGLARAQRDATLDVRARAEALKDLKALSKTAPGQWRVWHALVTMQLNEIDRAVRAGQEDVVAERRKELDQTLQDAAKGLANAGGDAAAALARMKLLRLVSDARRSGRVQSGQIDPLALTAATDDLVKSVLQCSSGSQVREAAGLLAATNQSKRAIELLDEWVQKHPQDLRSRATAILIRARYAGRTPDEVAAVRAAAKALVDEPQLSTSLDARMQETLRASAVGAILGVELNQLSEKSTDAERKAVIAELEKIRAQLLTLQQNDENKPAMLAADAKIFHIKQDYVAAQKKWDQYFSATTAPTEDAYLWASMTAQARNDLGLALQRATQGTEAYPGDIQLALQRADMSMRLGRWVEAESILSDLAVAFPDNPEMTRALQEVRRRMGSATGEPTELAKRMKAIDAAIQAKDWVKARQLVADLVTATSGAEEAMAMQAGIEMLAGDKAKAKELVQAAQAKYPRSLGLARIEAELATDDPMQRIEMMVNRVIEDPKRRDAELLQAFRSLRSDLSRQLQAASADPVKMAELQKQLAAVSARITEAEKTAMQSASDDPAVVQAAFAEALAQYLSAKDAQRTDEAQAALGRARAQMDLARKIANSPELPIVLESYLMETQGQVAEAAAMVQKARAAGRTEAALTARLAGLQERLGNEQEALTLWKEAYDRRPNDADTVIGYARAMARASNGAQALEMLRAAAESNPVDARLAMLQAQFEATYGTRGRAIEVREELNKRLRPIPENIAALYSLLYMPPSYDTLKGTDGKPLSASAWTGLTPEQRGRLLSDQARVNRARAEQLYADIIAQNPTNLQLAVQKARVMRDQSMPAEGAAAIQAVIDATKARGPVPSNMYLELGVHHLAANQPEAAEAAFAEARKAQDPQKREADLALVEIQNGQGKPKEAAAALANWLETNPRLDMQARLCELQMQLGDFEAAEASLAKVRSLAGSNPAPSAQAAIEILGAALDTNRGGKAERMGDLDAARSYRDKALAALAKAEQLAPSAYLAPLRRVEVLRAQARAGGVIDQRTYDLAVAEVERLLSRNAGLLDAAMMRADLALDKGDRGGAIGALERYLKVQPMDEQARARLIQLYVVSDLIPKALDQSRAAVELFPTKGAWREQLGDLLSISGNHAEAAAAYELAFRIAPDMTVLLAKAVDEHTANNAPQQSLAIVAAAPVNAQSDPVVRAAQAVAFYKLNRQAEFNAVAREAILGARAAGIESPAMQRVLPRLRTVFPKDKTKELEALITSTGTPNSAEKVLIGALWGDSGPDGADKALEWANAALADGDKVPAPLRATAMSMKGNALYTKGDAKAAVEAFRAAADLEPRNANALNNAAYIMAEQNADLAKALDYAERAVAVAPETPQFLDSLGFVLLKQAAAGDAKAYQRAEDALKRSLIMQETAPALLHLGMVQSATGRATEARRSLERAKQLPNTAPDIAKQIDEALKGLK